MNWQRIDKRRKEKGLTWAALSAEAGIADETRRNWVKYAAHPDFGAAPDPHKLEAFKAVLIEHGLLRVSTR